MVRPTRAAEALFRPLTGYCPGRSPCRRDPDRPMAAANSDAAQHGFKVIDSFFQRQKTSVVQPP